MIDTHAHLDFPQFDADREVVIERFLVGGGKWLVNIGVNTERNQKTLELVEKYEQIYCSLGYHPEELAEKSLTELLLEAEKFLLEKGRNKKVLAIGEIGLDYFHNSQNKIEQKKLFNKQLEIAFSLNLPVILHCRDAYEDVYDIISKFSAQGGPASGWQTINSKQIQNSKIQKEKNSMKFVLHCYGGNLEQTEKFLQLPGVYFSFTGNITFPKVLKSPLIPLSEGKENSNPPVSPLPTGQAGLILKRDEKMSKEVEIFSVIRKIPLGKIMAETDCPFLAPNPFRGKRNEPNYVKLVIERLAEIRGLSFEEMEKITDKNAERFFRKNFF